MSQMPMDSQVFAEPRVAAPALRLASLRRAVFALLLAVTAVGGFAITGPASAAQAAANAGEDLTRLLQAMAALKAAFIVPAAAAIFWRLGAAIRPAMFAAYAAAAAAMALSIGLIWDMVHVGLGAALMHAGLIAALVLLFRDKAVGERLAMRLKTRALA